MYTAIWEIINEEREDYGTTETATFDTIEEAKEWFDFRFKHLDYYCIVFNFCCSPVLVNHKD